MSPGFRLAAVGDIHCTKRSKGVYRPMFARASSEADVLLLCGDLTDYGLTEEARVLADEIRSSLTIPAVAVLGNHDHESGQAKEVTEILEDAGVAVLDGMACEIKGIHFAGAKGFGGGFGSRSVAAWGESYVKDFVHAGVNEAEKLDSALARSSQQTVVLLHYSPIAATVEGEPKEIFPFLGSSHLEEALNRHSIKVVFHGHAHHGTMKGVTSAGIPVFNVAQPLVRATLGRDVSFFTYNLDAPEDSAHLRPNS